MLEEEYLSHDALSLATLIARGEVTELEVLNCAKQIYEKNNPKLNAVITDMWEEAHRAIETELPRGQLQGVPMPLKDLGQYYKGVVTSNGSKLFSNNIADHDSTLVQRYKAAGIVLSGKTNSPEFGLATTTEPVLHGPSKNPWSHKHSTGGSSGGAAAAVASGMFPVAHASDGGGSIRIPASCCGLFGLKPTRGRIPLGPTSLEGWGGLSTTHVISRRVRDSAALLDISAGPEPGSPYHAPSTSRTFLSAVAEQPSSLKIALCVEPFNGAQVCAEVSELTLKQAKELENLGHHIEIMENPFTPEIVRDSHGTLAICHIGAMLNAKQQIIGRSINEKDVERVTWNNYQSSMQVTGPQYAAAVGQVQRHGQMCATIFEKYDLIFTPTMACLPPKLGALDTMSPDTDTYLSLLYQMIGFTALFNDTGNPAVSVPLAVSESGLPVGCQLIGKFGDEGLLLSVSQQLYEAGLFRLPKALQGKSPLH